MLITDGEDTCQPLDPCEVARDIAAKGIDLTIDTLGLIPDASTRSQLSCIADATGGTYTTVQHRQQLSTRVKQLVTRSTDPMVNPVATQGGADCTAAPQLHAGLYTDRETFSQNRWYRVDVLPGQELRASVSIAADRAVNPDYGVLLRAVTLKGREIVRDDEGGTGRTDVVSAGVRYPKPSDDSDSPPPETVCLQVGNSFSAGPSVKTTPGLPLELSVDLVDSPDQASDVAFLGLGRRLVAARRADPHGRGGRTAVGLDLPLARRDLEDQLMRVTTILAGALLTVGLLTGVTGSALADDGDSPSPSATADGGPPTEAGTSFRTATVLQQGEEGHRRRLRRRLPLLGGARRLRPERHGEGHRDVPAGRGPARHVHLAARRLRRTAPPPVVPLRHADPDGGHRHRLHPDWPARCARSAPGPSRGPTTRCAAPTTYG